MVTNMSPEALSAFPNRPIRPLPKRRLRERLSPEVAGSIAFPPAPKIAPPLFYHPYSIQEEIRTPNGLVESQHPSERERADDTERNYISRRNGNDLDSGEDETAYRSRIYSRHSAESTGRSYRYVQKPDTTHANFQRPASASSSADGYDSFENSNNKKKRKIPTPGDSNVNGVHLPGDISGSVGPDDLAEDVGSDIGSYHSTVSGHGISGPGRGRYGRIRNGRSPLRTLSDASGNCSNGRIPKQRQPWPPLTETPGIISRSIADANAEKYPITPSRSQENVSLLHEEASKRTSPASTQFTFTCDSQVPGTVPWPGPSSSSAMNQSPAAMKMHTQATQTSPSIPANLNTNPAARAKQVLAASQHNPDNEKGFAPAAPPKKNRRRAAKEYMIAARQRRQQQEYRNYHHPPAPEDIWICEFCEYERIFGTPPEALIKQYEYKDRKSRKQEAERRRLLEKAKLKGRKGKKGSKGAAKSTAPPNRTAQAQSTQPRQSLSQETQSEEYFEDDYDDGDGVAEVPNPPSSPTGVDLPRNTLPSNPGVNTSPRLGDNVGVDSSIAT